VKWVKQFEDSETSPGRTIRKELQDAFFVDAADWKHMVLTRWREVTRQAVVGLTRQG